ncbi:MAG: AAA family ATPase [bacterium]|nr:AAA family ATPase [bacterium]
MIDKIISIKNVGRFSDFSVRGGTLWNGTFKKINVIYAVNGSGKTTLTSILKSLKSNSPKLVNIKRSFSTGGDPSITIKDDSNNLYEFKDNGWSKPLSQMEIFDIHFVEDYLFTGSTSTKRTREGLFELLLGSGGLEFKKKGKKIIKQKLAYEEQLKPFRRRKKGTPEVLEPISDIKEKLSLVSEELNTLISSFNDFAEPVYKKQIHITNQYLTKFAPYIKVTGLKNQRGRGTQEYEVFRTYLTLDVHGHAIEFLQPDYIRNVGNVKFTLSEGDKSALALSFFLARLEILGVSNKIVVFDDPISSFDYGRKTRTINELARLASKCEQFFILTHDIFFAKEITDKLSFLEVQNVKVEFNGTTSKLNGHDINTETETRLKTEIRIVQDFIDNGSSSKEDNLKILRCLRPILEGAIKSKYFDNVDYNNWLGDIIQKIKDSEHPERLHKLTPLLQDIIDINDFTKEYHHANSEFKPDRINPLELSQFAKLTIETYYKI